LRAQEEPPPEEQREGEPGAQKAPPVFSPLQKASVGRAGSLCCPPPFECPQSGCREAFFSLRFGVLRQERCRKRLKAILEGRDRTSCEQSDFHSSRCCGRDTHCRSDCNFRLLSVRGGGQADDVFDFDDPRGHLPLFRLRRRKHNKQRVHEPSGLRSRRGEGGHREEQYSLLD